MKCHTLKVSIILFALMKVSFELPGANPKAEPCFGLFLGVLGVLFRAFRFRGYGGRLGRRFVRCCRGYSPGMYYGGAPYQPYPEIYYPYPPSYYPSYPQPYYPYPQYYYPPPRPYYVPYPYVPPGGPVVLPVPGK